MIKYFHEKKGQKGFTLIELLVVIAIIGILATIALVSLNTARSKARDTRRVSDLRQIALALEMYYDDTGGYPVQAACAAIATPLSVLTTTYMGALPVDPGTTNTYFYGGTAEDYILRAILENTIPTGSYAGAEYTCGCAGPTYYCIRP